MHAAPFRACCLMLWCQNISIIVFYLHGMALADWLTVETIHRSHFTSAEGPPTFLRKCCHCCTTSSPDANSLQVPQLQWLRASCICLPAMPRSLMPSEKSLNAQAVTQATIVSPQGTGCSLAESQPRRFDFKYLHTAKGAADRRGGTWTH